LPDRELLLLGVDNDVWHKPRREPGDLAEARLFAFLRGSMSDGGWRCGTRVSIESMEEKTAYIHGGQGARQGC
jgi:hypothetical protein